MPLPKVTRRVLVEHRDRQAKERVDAYDAWHDYGLVFPTQVAIVGVVLTLPIIIMLHEAAHFFAAKRTGMKVTEFFVGFGQGTGTAWFDDLSLVEVSQPAR